MESGGPARPGGIAPAEDDDDIEPNANFTIANDRLFVAWSRTALALVIAGVAIDELPSPVPGLPEGKHVMAIPMIVLGAVTAVISYIEWRRNERAARLMRALPRSWLPRILVISIAVLAALAIVVVVLAAVKG